MSKVFLLIGGGYGLLGVVLGAFGAHALQARLSADLLQVWQTAVAYHFWHALALLAVGMIARHLASVWLTAAGTLFTLGVLVFSGSLYLLAITGLRALGAVTPIGGVLLIAGWACLLVAILRS